MYIEVQKVRGIAYLRLVKNVSSLDAAGKKQSKKRIVLSIGKLSDYDDGQPNYLERLRQSFRDGRPLIPALKDYVGTDDEGARKTAVWFRSGSEECRLDRLRYAAALLDPLFRDLGLNGLLAQLKHRSKAEYDLTGLTKLLVYGRLLDPKSKRATVLQNASYYDPPTKKKFNPTNIYDVLDDIYGARRQIFRTLNTNITKKAGRDTSVLLYDVTNVFCHIDGPDEDVVAEDGTVIQSGLRKRGKSKEHRPDPIVQVALFTDRAGIPLYLTDFSGNVPDISAMRPALSEALGALEIDKFLFVADRGICSRMNRLALKQKGFGYVIAKSIQCSSEADQNWILEDSDWINVSTDFRYKSREITETFKDDDGVKHDLKQKVVVYWSRKYYEKELAEHAAAVAFLEALQTEDGLVPLNKLEKTYVRKNFRKEVIVRSKDGKPSGEMIPKSELLQKIDKEKLERDVKLLGYYQIITSECYTPAQEVIRIYKNLVKIEDEFREMKTTLEARPMYVRTPEHIMAHLIVCFIALTMMRLIQMKVVKKFPELKKGKLWTWGLSGERLRSALNNWQLAKLPDDHFAFTHECGDTQANADLNTLLSAYEISIPYEVFTRGELRKLTMGIKTL